MAVFDEHGIFIFPSFFEGFGKVFLEAMARGLCVIAADNGGAHDVIRSGVNGVLVPTGSRADAVAACQSLEGSFPQAFSMSREAAISAQSYTWERTARETIAFYDDRLAAKSSST